MFITEFGMDAFDQSNGQEFPNNAQIVADYFSNLWQEIQTNPVCSGGCVFSYSDEWWKAPGGSPGLHDQGGYMNPNFPDQFLNEEWWGIFSVSNNGSSLNILTPRAVFFQIQELWRPPSAPFALRLMSNQWQTVFLRDSWRPDIIYELASSSTLSNWTTVACSAGRVASEQRTQPLSSAYNSVGLNRVSKLLSARQAYNMPPSWLNGRRLLRLRTRCREKGWIPFYAHATR
jgi:hypothetical protein